MASTITTLTSSPNPSTAGQIVTFTATVVPEPPATGTPTGTVLFVISNDGPALTGILVNGQASVSVALTQCQHSVVASYSGDGTFDGSGSPELVQNVLAQTTTTVTASPSPSVCGQPVTFTVTVAPVPPGTGTPTGNVTLTVAGDGPPQTQSLNAAGQATFTVTGLTAGSHAVTASYAGDACFTSSTSTQTTQTVNQAATTTTVTSSPNPSTVGQLVTFTATVAAVPPGVGTPSGSVTFTISNGPTLTGTLNAGQATVTTSALSVGSHNVTAVYNGDACFAGSTSSSSLVQVVNPSGGGTATTLTATPATIRLRTNQTFVIPTLSATLTNTASGAGIPGQTITFTANPATGPVTLGTAVTNSSGVATLSNVVVSATLITASQYTATFAGGGGFNPATANAPLTFQPLPFLP